MIQVAFFSRSDERPLTTQLEEYADRIVNDRHSFNVLEAFLTQMESLFGSLAALLERESDHLADDGIGWSVMRQEHEQLTDRLETQLTDFVGFLRAVLSSAQRDARFLRRHRDSIADLFTEGSLRIAFLESAEKGIDDEQRFLEALDFLDELRKRSVQLTHDLRKLSEAFGQGDASKHDKTLALLESCRMRASKLHDECGKVSEHIPGLREIDSAQARKLGMLSRSLQATRI